MDWKKIQHTLGVTVVEALREYVDKECEIEAKQAAEFQRIKDIKKTVMALIAVKQDDITNYRLLDKIFGVESIKDAEEIVLQARVSHQIICLREFLTENGMSLQEFRQYSKENNLELKLKDNSKLRYLSVEKLKKEISKNCF